jgi:hypothetical protein
MIELISVPHVHRPPGTYNLPSTQLGMETSYIEIAMTRDGLPDGLVAMISFERSTNGIDWMGCGGCTVEGGDVYNRDGILAPETFYRLGPFSSPMSATSRVRGTVILYQAATAGIKVRVY